MKKQDTATVDIIMALAKRRGFVYPSSEIYGGLANTWDFGHYGTLLRNNVRDSWWKRFVLDREDVVGVNASIFLNPKVWEASGHVAGFADALVDCKKCHNRTRADHLIEDYFEKEQENIRKTGRGKSIPVEMLSNDKVLLPGSGSVPKKVEGLPVEELTKIIRKYGLKCPTCGSKELTDVRRFNLLFETSIGIVEESKSKVYLRGEIAQGIFLNFKNVIDTMRVRIPFGIAQQGKAFRNEITMGQFVHRTLEFDLMEFEYFIHPSEWKKVYKYWQKEMWSWALDLGLTEKNLQWREHEEFERSHYSIKTMDIEYHYPFGWKEMFGLAYRTDFDLKNHSKHSGKNLSYRDPNTGESFIPHVVEPTFGLSRLVGILLFDAYHEEDVKGKKRVFLKLHPSIAPIKVAIFPLQKDEKLSLQARLVFDTVKDSFSAEFDDIGNIGKMYRRQDEIGTPFCITVDYESLQDKKVTVRDRDTMKQVRVSQDRLVEYLSQRVYK